MTVHRRWIWIVIAIALLPAAALSIAIAIRSEKSFNRTWRSVVDQPVDDVHRQLGEWNRRSLLLAEIPRGIAQLLPSTARYEEFTMGDRIFYVAIDDRDCVVAAIPNPN